MNNRSAVQQSQPSRTSGSMGNSNGGRKR
jgi:hypothetical protein